MKTTRLSHINVEDRRVVHSKIVDQATEEGEGEIPKEAVMKAIAPEGNVRS